MSFLNHGIYVGFQKVSLKSLPVFSCSKLFSMQLGFFPWVILIPQYRNPSHKSQGKSIALCNSTDCYSATCFNASGLNSIYLLIKIRDNAGRFKR